MRRFTCLCAAGLGAGLLLFFNFHSPEAFDAQGRVEFSSHTGGPSAAPADRRGDSAASVPAGVSASQWPSIRAQIEAEQRAFARGEDGALSAFSPRGGERLELTADGSARLRLRGDVSVVAPAIPAEPLGHVATVGADDRPDMNLVVKTMGLGRGDEPAGLIEAAAAVLVAKNRAERSMRTQGAGAVTEWWRSEERGFELGWTVAEKPSGDGWLRLDLDLNCPWPAQSSLDGRRLTFRDPADSGWEVLCDGLVASDATGRALPARMAATEGRLTISVDDTDAAYPVVIDPWLYGERVATLRANDAVTGARFGARVQACGDVFLVQARDPAINGEGQAYIFSSQGANYVPRRKVLGMMAPSESGTTPLGVGSVAGDVVAIGPLQSAGGIKTRLYERNVGGPSAFGQVAEVDMGTVSFFGHPRLSGDLLAVPLEHEPSGGVSEAGLLRVYRRDAGGPSAWGLVATLDAADLRFPSGFFGIGAALDGNTLVTFARVSASALSCFVFEKSASDATQWTRTKTFQVPGLSLAVPVTQLLGDTLAVGFPGVAGEGVRLYGRHTGGQDSWGLVRTLPVPPGESSTGFSLALLGGLLAVGTPDEDVDHDGNPGTAKIMDAGMVRVFARDAGGVEGWGLVQTFSDGAVAEADGRFGEAVAFADGRLFIGRPKGDPTLPTVVDAGLVTGFALLSGAWGSTPLPAASQNGTGWGTAVAASGPYVLVGVPLYNGAAGVDAGWAFLFRDGLLVTPLVPPNQQAGEQFGSSVAIEGDRLVIGSPLRSGVVNMVSYADLGAVTVFERNQGGADIWAAVKTILGSPSTASASPKFGTSMALAGDVLAVGGPEETALSLPGSNVRGRVKIFYRNTGGANNWGIVKSFQGDDNGAEEMFGTSVALSGDTLVVGAPLEEVGGLIRSGAAYLHRRNQGGADNWGRIAKLTQPVVKGDSWFGQSVAIDGDDVLVGAPHEDRLAEPNVGAAYFFAGGRTIQDTWAFTHRYQPEDFVTEDRSGTAVALSHGLGVIGVPGASHLIQVVSRDVGGADQWGLVGGDNGGESYGTAVAMEGTHLAVGAPLTDVLENNILQTDRGLAFSLELVGAEFAAVATREAGASASALGASVALHRDWLAVGAPDEDVNNDADAGAAYVFHRDRLSASAWGLVQRLVDVQDNAAGTRFGAALAVDAQWLMVGVPGASRVQTYYRQDLVPSPAAPWVDSVSLSAGGQPNALGTSLAMENGVLIAGAPLQDVSGNADSGAAYLFERNMVAPNAWGLLTPLTPSDPGPGDAFGTSVALSENRAALGAPLDNNGEGIDAGAIYLFERNQGGPNAWGEVLKITNGAQNAGDEMGASLALMDAYLLVGLPKADTIAGVDAGRALLFDRNQGGAGVWGLIKNLIPPDGSTQSRFGASVAVDADHAVVGAPFADPRGVANAGAAYVFSREWTGDEAWALLQTLAPTECSAGAQFGASLALDRTMLAFGAPGDATTGRVHLHVFRARQFYDDWAVTHGLEGEWALPEADADGDGQANLIELILGGHPLDGGVLGRETLVRSANSLVLTAYKDGTCLVTVGLTAEVSGTLQTWSTVSPGDVLVDNASLMQIQVPFTAGGRQFARWRATLP